MASALDKEELNIKRREYYRLNKTKITENRKRFYHLNKDKINKKRKEYYHKNIDKFRNIDSRKRSHDRYYKDIELSRAKARKCSIKRRMRAEVREYDSIKFKEYWRNLRYEILAHYSGDQPKCAHCGFSDIRALCIDHIYNDGYAERKKLKGSNTRFYKMIKDNNFPPRYQVLCHNCNFIKKIEKDNLQ